MTLAPALRPWSTRSALLGLCAALLCLSISACGAPRDPEDPSGAAQSLARVPWKEKNRQERMDWMGVSVFPKMRVAFAKFDQDRFGDFSCQTCHGETMELADYHMPNTLYALSRTDTIAKARAYDAAVTDFMTEDVMPEMAKLLGESPYDATTRSGFGCFGCHPAER
jgi:hypothetical protein